MFDVARLGMARRGAAGLARRDEAGHGKDRRGSTRQAHKRKGLTMAARNTDVLAELEQIRRRGHGVLKCHAVVAFARNPKTALHGQFEWDDTKAAQEFRLWQARELIAVSVTVLHGRTDPVRAYVSLGSDRIRPGGGYRSMEDVLADPERRAEMLEDAKRDMEVFVEKYEGFAELAGVFAAMRSVGKRQRKAG